ncbi:MULTISPECIES: fumarate hydratase [Phyllobacteriaceae]|jgi:fumarate hydratase, class I|uniref:Fumarate hydratase class I n=1 Tax=Mesorhizobium hungaricum TaxID=1566387 RepID=A0A1C2DVV0_9HYPH|nr:MULTISPECIES: fumarate hydratase [Mesorhizobium]MBN9233936.1 fumarate hydratase [Mesorhizobium sp.]MDQ0331467.1 fumarate hydratase class I [Mesorhizobium sp. YL-MeA3-2017]OCX18891.1 fumarate hydratase [Mesorhizobium hungaricum]
MIVIRENDLRQSIRDAFQLISFAHPRDFVRHLAAAWEREESPLAKSAMGQILVNSRMALLGRRPICQDTGVASVFLRVGMNVRIDTTRALEDIINDGVRAAYCDDANPLRSSIVDDPLFGRSNTHDNTPAIVHVELVPGDTVEVFAVAKGAGSENKTKFAVLLPRDDVISWIVDQVSHMGAGWCPPGVLGIGIGGNVERAMLMAKKALLSPLDMHELVARGAADRLDEMRLEIYNRVNALGIGAQGLGGNTTVLDVKILTQPTHAASLPIALIPNCAAHRHVHFVLDGSGPAELEAPCADDWPQVVLDQTGIVSRQVDLDTLSREDVQSWRAGQTLLFSGKLLTARDAAHHRITRLLSSGDPLPVPLAGRVIYYVGPVDAAGDEIIGPAGPTTANRMDPFMGTVLGAGGAFATIGKGERGPGAIEAIQKNGAASLIAVGGAAYLISKSIRSARVVAFEDLGMEAIHEFEVKDMPVIVAVDASGRSIHDTGPAKWRRS